MKHYFVRYKIGFNDKIKFLIYTNHEDDVYKDLVEDVQKEILRNNGFNINETHLVDIIAFNLI
jgi:hypothetical protein